MTQKNFQKLNQIVKKADMLHEAYTGQRNVVINYLNEMIKQGYDINDIIKVLDEGFLTWITGKGWDPSDDGSKEYAAAKQAGKGIDNERKQALIGGTAQNVTPEERAYIDKKLAVEKRQANIKRDIVNNEYQKTNNERLGRILKANANYYDDISKGVDRQSKTNDYLLTRDLLRQKGNEDQAKIYDNYARLNKADTTYDYRKNLANDINSQLDDQKNKAFEIGKNLTDEQKKRALLGQGTTEAEKSYGDYKRNINDLSAQQKSIADTARDQEDDWAIKKKK